MFSPLPADSPSPGHPRARADGSLGFAPYGSSSNTWPADTPQFLDDGSSPSAAWRFDEFAQDPGYIAYQEELRDLIFHTATNAAPTRDITPVSSPSPDSGAAADEGVTAGTAEASAVSTGAAAAGNAPLDPSAQHDLHRQTAAVLSQGRRFEYLKIYVGQVAPWLDMFDSGGRAFAIQLPVLARTSPALLYALLALSARQRERREGRRHSSFDSLELYQEAIRLLTPLLQARDPLSVPICTILCVMEMMSASARDWRKHLEGCAALFDAFGVHGFSGGLFQAVFWCYARMDVCGALISDGTQGTLVPPAKWLAPGADETRARELFRAAESPDAHANYAVYLCAKVCWLTADRTRFVELGETNGCDSEVFAVRWQGLWDDLQVWLDERPPEMLPAQTLETRPFPQILFAHWAAISSSQLYHTACILLLNMMPRSVPAPEGLAGSATWHARRVCGISLTNPHEGCLNNAVQPLWVAGKLLSHRSEHALVVKLIRNIEAMTGWAASWRIADLEAAWGYRAYR
ncbi:C6 zinc finger domain-containing protein [Pleurostoma richardsiae]|uniref:C6 zinc finger domain-containing protein n=1 Tax=Pleurostoma richardsiae TaxID=41990 RepID=A0AA38RFK4_9PEZI|nr:C6 zinc finger domain-containing protein [Pleurostoma richardsiae]